MKRLLGLAALLGLSASPAIASENGAAFTRTAVIVLHLNAPPAAAFPLFDPVNESKWDPSWKPHLLGSRVEEGLLFLVGDGADRATWLIDRYDPVGNRIAYVVAGRSALTRIAIEVVPEGPGSKATVTYTKTALDAHAIPNIEHFVQHFPLEREHWESAINAALK